MQLASILDVEIQGMHTLLAPKVPRAIQIVPIQGRLGGIERGGGGGRERERERERADSRGGIRDHRSIDGRVGLNFRNRKSFARAASASDPDPLPPLKSEVVG